MLPDWYTQGIDHIWQPYAQAKIAPSPLAVARTQGCEIILHDGRHLIDGISSWWSAVHGHNHPHLLEAAHTQLDVMPHIMFAGLAHEPAYALAHELIAIAPQGLQRVFYSDSGSTAVEVALKIAAQYWVNRGYPEKSGFICLEHAYHGDTYGAMGVSDPLNGMHHAYLPNLKAHPALPVPLTEDDLNAWEDALARHAPHSAAFILEPLVQGAGGMRFYPPAMLRAMHDICQRHHVFMIADEIMTGFGRLGAMFACHLAGITPDIMCIGKGLTGGVMTLAATLTTEAIYEAFYDDDVMKALMHGPTFMANPLACAVARASLQLFAHEPRLAHAHAIEEQCHASLLPLRDVHGVQDVRCMGALAVVELDATRFNAFAARPRFVELGCWLRPYKNLIYLMPPLVILPEQLEKLTNAVIEVVHDVMNPKGA
ncbi:MAG: adenosylmethionine--8-amino-7-oxononanoate transaminase [Alphaproteobacteria bacterium]|nr:MAG: adenosylmethionine--8-amino-7-oxononanoate transaminase [Alphaproteobacteria bacterium]